MSGIDSQIQISAQAGFSAAHLYHQKAWSKEQNQQTFGACFSTHGHGHDYVVRAWISAPISKSSVELEKLERVLEACALEFDHKHLNFDLPDFQDRIPTSEEIAQVFWGKIQRQGPDLKLTKLRVYERPDLWAELQR